MNSNPKFHVGDRVWSRRMRTIGRITSVVNIDDIDDIAIQGHRYYVQYRFWTYSEGERELQIAEKKVSDISGEETTKTGNRAIKRDHPVPDTGVAVVDRSAGIRRSR